MTLKFKLGKQKKDGSCPLQIRFKDKGRDSIISVSGVFVYPKFWLKEHSRVSTNHPASNEINEKIADREKKLLEIRAKYSIGTINFDIAKRMLSNSSVLDSIHAFIDVYCVGIKPEITVINYRNVVKAFSYHTGIKEPLFSDITHENFIRIKKSLDEKGRSKQTLNSYLKNIKAICNYAKKKKITFYDFDFDSDWGNKKVKITPSSVTSKQIKEAIDRIKVHAKKKKSPGYLLRDFEAIGIWLLMFAMRGLLPKDICQLSSRNLDYDFEREILIHKKRVPDKIVALDGNRHIYNHDRSKSGNSMRMLLVPPIQNLITMLQNMISSSHPSLSFFSKDDFKFGHNGIIFKKPIDEIDFMRLFNGDVNISKNYRNLFRNYNNHLTYLKMPSFKTARSTFMTTSTNLDISPAIGRAMMGQTDQTISIHYNDFGGPDLFKRVTEAHIKTLQGFRFVELFNHWLKTHDEIFETRAFRYFGLSKNSNLFYSKFLDRLDSIIRRKKIMVKSRNI